MSDLAPPELVQIVTTDLVALTRGRAVALADEEAWQRSGVGWVPANLALTPFGAIATPNPFGAVGDLRLRPDPTTAARVVTHPERPPLHLVLADITQLDGTPWACCPRGFLRAALADLEAAGLRLAVAFEQEFTLRGLPGDPAPAFSVAAHRRAEPLLTRLFAALREIGTEPEVILPEYGTDQFEIACRPATPLGAADRAVLVRAVVRDMADASFCPKTDPHGVGNGVHIHFSLRDTADRPVTYDPSRPGALSVVAGAFAAGVLRHLPALCAVTASAPVSYLRLVPHHWSAAFACLGERNRETALRICPLPGMAPDPARAFNLEFRPADATANPYLALAVLVRAGLEGVRAGLEPPPLVNVDPADLPPDEHRRLGITPLPSSLVAALAALEADETVSGWFAPDLLQTFRGVKAKEIDGAAGLSDAELCTLYRAVY